MEKSSKEEFVFDTSALISLGSIKIIDDVLKIAEIIITPSVVKELQDFAKFNDAYGKASKEVLKYKTNFCIEQTHIKEDITFIGKTDNELYNLGKQKSLTIITDDIKFARHVNNKIDVQFSTFFLTALIEFGYLSKKKALNLLETLRDTRNWKNNIIYLTTKKILDNL